MVTWISTHVIVELTMLDDDDDDDVDTVKVPLMDASNPDKGNSLSVDPHLEGKSLATNVVEKFVSSKE
jgi:hypothetical protein